MLIQCTKKLLDELDIKPESSYAEDEPLFSWHAHLITVNRRKTVVLVNDQNRYVVVLHGIKAKDVKNFDKVLLQAIRETLMEEGIKDEIIEKYILHSEQMTFTKTKDRTSVARMNKACENVYFYEDLLDAHSIFNPRISTRVSRLLVGAGKNDYICPHEEMYKDLEVFASEPIFRVKAVQLKVTLMLEKRRVWRRIVVPLHRTFQEFHDILQTAFGWRDCHLHEFYMYDETVSTHDLSVNHSAYHREGYKPIVHLVCDEEAFAYSHGIEMKLETRIKLSEYLPVQKRLKYNYDFGDHWQHDIEVEKVVSDYHVNHPVCLEGKGNTPPEDVGGMDGYEAFLEIIANPNHPEHKETVGWGVMQGFEEFDMERINRILKNR